MANFECKVYKIDDVIEHPNADRLNLVKIKGFTCIANKLEDGSPRYKAGDLVVYIPENALLPQWMLVKLGLWSEEKMQGVLAGNEGNRCKAIRLRGIYSEGILYPINMNVPFTNVDTNEVSYSHMLEYADPNREYKTNTWVEVHEGDNVSEYLGVTKYEPKIPQHMAGECFGAGDIFYHYDIESIAKYPDVIQEGEKVRITEKIHGTQTRIQFSLYQHKDGDQCFIKEINGTKVYIYIASKGLGDKGICFKSVEANANNVYVMAFNDYFTDNKIKEIVDFMLSTLNDDKPVTNVTLFGETFGNTQDLHYGVKSNEHNKLNFFDMTYGKEFVNFNVFKAWLKLLELPMVPLLYQGEFSKDLIDTYTNGKSIYDNNQIREGCVITPIIERYDDEIGRVILKSVSESYKLRKNGTEFN